MDIYARFFLSLLNARSPCRDCNSAIIPRLRTTYRTNLFASSYFCRTSGPHLQDHTQDQFCSKFRAKRLLRAKRRTNSAANSYFCHTSGPQGGPFSLQIACKIAAWYHSQDHGSPYFLWPYMQNKREPRSAAPVLHCVRCVKKDRPY